MPTLVFLAAYFAMWTPSCAADEITLEDLTTRVGFLYQVIPGSSGTMTTSYGSGFVVVDDSGTVFLVTAAHVAAELGPSARLVIQSSGTVAREFELSRVAADSAGRWIYDKTADVAVLRVASEHSGFPWVKHGLPIRYLRAGDDAPHRTQQLLLMGFPLTLGVAGKFSPITKLVLTASDMITLPRFDTHQPEDFFLVDYPAIEGYSGAPVFAFPSDIPFGVGEIRLGNLEFCAGLVHGAISDRTGGKLGAVVPAKYILEALRAARSARP